MGHGRAELCTGQTQQAQKDRQTERRIDRHNKYRRTDRQRDSTQTERSTEGQTDTDTQRTHTQRDRQTEYTTCTILHAQKVQAFVQNVEDAQIYQKGL